MEADKREQEILRRKRRRREQIRRARRRRVMRMRLILCGIVLVLVLAVVLVIRGKINSKAEEEQQERLLAARQKRAQLIEENTLDLLAVGDNIIHDNILEAGKSEDAWNYDFLYEQITPTIQEADLAIVNQETIFINDHASTAGYPLFGSPIEVGDSLVKAGFDVVQHATNHTYDMGEEGVLDTLNFWGTNYPDITVLGIQKTQEEKDTITVKEVKNFKLAMLNYTQYINFDSLPESRSYLVDTLNEEKVAADVALAKESADFIICFLHAGEEDSTTPNADMKQWISFLAEQGVDLVIGTHPHVLQKYEMVERPDGGEMLVYYSLGNFASTQKTINGLLGGMADIKLCKDWNTGEVSVQAYDLIPTFMHYNHDTQDYCVYELSEYTDELAANHGVLEEISTTFTVEDLETIVKERLKTED